MHIIGYGDITINNNKYKFKNHIHVDQIPRLFWYGFRHDTGSRNSSYRNPRVRIGEIDETTRELTSTAITISMGNSLEESVDMGGEMVRTYKFTGSGTFDGEGRLTGFRFDGSAGRVKISSIIFSEVGIPNQDVIAQDTISVTYYFQISMNEDPLPIGTIPVVDGEDIQVTINPANLHSGSSVAIRRTDKNEVALRTNFSNGDYDWTSYRSIGNHVRMADGTNRQYTPNDYFNGEVMLIRYDNDSTLSREVSSFSIIGIANTRYSRVSGLFTIAFSSPVLVHPGGYIELKIRPTITGSDTAYASVRIRVALEANPVSAVGDIPITIYDGEDNILFTGLTDEEGVVYIGGIEFGEIFKVSATVNGVETAKHTYFANEYHQSINVLI